jgi:nucleotide-binding universal stress UspA family protein
MLKTILVSLNNIDALEGTMTAASAIARRYDCHVVGLYVIPSIIVYSAPYGYGSGVQYIDHNKYFKTHASKVEQAFEDFIRKDGLIGEWRQVHSEGYYISHAIVEHGREADMIVMSNRTRKGQSDVLDIELCARIVQESGRPVLVTPYTDATPFKIKKAVIGWDGSRESARATFDAVPLLQMADQVHVSCVNPARELEIYDELPGSEIAAALDRHDINVTTETIKTRKRVGAALLERAEKADLLVIGAYGHSRLRENILGGVTSGTLKKMTCPVLMSN